MPIARSLQRGMSSCPGLQNRACRTARVRNAWSLKEVVGHLIDSASNNHHRFVLLQSGNIDLPGYAQREWVLANAYQTEEYTRLANLWFHYNLHILHVVEHLPRGTLENVWRTENQDSISFAVLVPDYYRHLQHHLAKVRERSAGSRTE